MRRTEVKLHEVQQLSSDFFFRSSTERRRAETFSGCHGDRDLEAFPAWRAGPAVTLWLSVAAEIPSTGIPDGKCCGWLAGTGSPAGIAEVWDETELDAQASDTASG